MRSHFLMALGLCIATSAQAVSPLIRIGSSEIAFEKPHRIIPPNGVAHISYTVTNESSRPQRLYLKLPPGVEIDDRGKGLLGIIPSCNNLLVKPLESKKRCLFRLIAVAANIIKEGRSSTSGGPLMSFDPSGFSTFQPEPDDSLFIGVSPLNISVTALALSVNNVYPPFNALTGRPRKITLSSNGRDVPNVTFKIEPKLPLGTTFSPSNGRCGDITSQSSCTVTITPGSRPTNSPSILTVFENGKESYTVPIDILSYNSVYQSGYVFSIDDTTSDTQSVGGKVAALENQARIFPFGIIWASNGRTDCSLDDGKREPFRKCTDYEDIPGINELSIRPPDACNGKMEGACNTQQIVSSIQNRYGNVPPPGTDINSLYAAGLCATYITTQGYSDWYLPAICELGYYQAAPHTDINSYCGTPDDPLMQNLASNLNDNILRTMQGPFWSSTEYSHADLTLNNAWSDYFTSNIQTHDGKENTLGVRCVRAMTQPPSPTS